MPGQGFRGDPRQLFKAFRWSMLGLAATWKYEASFRLEAGLSVVLVPAGLWLGNDGIQRALLTAMPLLVLVVELLNSAIETVVDLVSPQQHELAGRAKDIGSAAVFITLVMTALTWLLILLPRWM